MNAPPEAIRAKEKAPRKKKLKAIPIAKPLTDAEKIKRGGVKQLAEAKAKSVHKLYDYQKEEAIKQGESKAEQILTRQRIEKLPIELRGLIKDYTTYNLSQDEIDRIKDLWETLEFWGAILQFCFEYLNTPESEQEIKPPVPSRLENRADRLLNNIYKVKRIAEDALEKVGLTTEGGLDRYDVEGYEQEIRSLGFISQESGYKFRKDWCEETLGEWEEELGNIENRIKDELKKNKPSEVNIKGRAVAREGLYKNSQGRIFYETR